MIRHLLSLSLVALVATTLPLAAQTPAAPLGYEVPPKFEASQILTPELLRGPHHQVRESAPSDGYLIHFTIDSDYGVFECVGVAELKKRVAEIAAITKLEKVRKSDLFAEGLKKSVGAPIKAVKNIVTKPGKTVKQVPRTVGHFFSKLGNSIENAANKVGNRSETKNDSKDSNPVKGIGNAVKGLAGFDKAKLNCARQVGVDPYSDNLVLQEKMDEVTWVFFAGGLPLRVGAAVTTSGVSTALNATKAVGLPEEIYDITPSELAFRDEKSLEAMGIAEPLVDQVFLRPSLTVSLRHSMVTSLEALAGASGREEVVKIMLACQTTRQAAFLNEVLRMLAERHRASPYVSIGVFGRLPAGITTDGIMEATAPLDYVAWTEQSAAFAHREGLADEGRRLILSGELSERAAREFQAAGWEIVRPGQLPR